MREILFRGRRVDNGEWVEGLLFYSHGLGVWKITASNGWMPSYNNPDEGVSTVYYDVDYNTVGQFTGFLDKNGKRIFEGDILRFPSGYRDYNNDPDSYGDYPWVKCDKDVVVRYEKTGFTNLGHFNGKGEFTAEIIGNIHDKTEQP